MEEGGSTPLVDRTFYRQLIGSLLYLTHSRTDLSYVVNDVASFMQEPHELCCKETKHILHYVQGTREFGIHYYVGAQLDLIGFIDSYWAGDSINRKSTLCLLFMLVPGPICWSGKKQVALSLSSPKADYRGDVNATILEVCLHGIVTEFGIHTSPSVGICCDNQRVIKISSDRVQKK